jgi:hypothetical protein
MSCNNNDSSSEISILGKWYNNRESDTEVGQPVWVAYQNDCQEKRDYSEFLANNILKDVYHSEFQDCEPDVENLSWTRNGNKLIVDGISADIILLNETVLQVRINDAEDDGSVFYMEFIR